MESFRNFHLVSTFFSLFLSLSPSPVQLEGVDGLSWPSAVIVNRREFIDGRCYRMHRRSKRTNRLSLLVVRICFANTIWQLANFFLFPFLSSFFFFTLNFRIEQRNNPLWIHFALRRSNIFLIVFSFLFFSFSVLEERCTSPPLPRTLTRPLIPPALFEIRSGRACCSLLFPWIGYHREDILGDDTRGRGGSYILEIFAQTLEG